MVLLFLSYIPVIVSSWLIGLATLLKNPKNDNNRFFALFTIFLGLWLGMLFLGDWAANEAVSLWFVRLATFFGTLMIASIIFLSVSFPTIIRKPRKLFIAINIALPLMFVILSLTPLLIPSVEIRNRSAQPNDLGIFYTLQTLYAAGGLIFSLVTIISKYRRVDALGKAQIRLVTGGLVAALLVNFSTGFILTITETSNNYSNLLGSISFLIFVGATAFAIVRHRMFDIRLAIVRTMGFLLTTTLVGALYTVIIIGVGAPLITGGEVSLIKNQPGLLLLVPPTLLIAFTFHSIQQYIAQVTRKFFYQDLYDVRKVLDEFSDSLIASNEIGVIMEKSLKVMSSAIKPTHARFVVFNEDGTVYRDLARHTKGPDSVTDVVNDIKQTKANPAIREELPVLPKSFMDSDVFLALRLGLKERPVGVILYGPKQNGRAYTTQDIDLLRISAKNLTIALENAKHYDQISHFAETLRGEVLRATADLRAANKELKTLDTMKDDFISMASHQLRTPATSVHEALQMMNHSDVKLSVEEKRRLAELAEASSEHLVNVVADMLSISRIQAGHFTITKAPGDLMALVDKVIKQTAVLAEQKRIVVDFQKPSTVVNVDFDTPKMNEAISNYVENAIKYSGEGTTVTVKIRIENERLYFEVADQGMGVPEAERKNLFGKFFRAGNARTLQPDGNGIGLFVVKSIAEGHGGDAYYQPLEPGSLFGFWLPLSTSENPAKQDTDNSQRKKS